MAVIGCGALGLTAATVLRRAGANVTIYAADRLADTRSSRATGTWSPDFSHRRRGRDGGRLSRAVGGDVPDLVPRLSELCRPGRIAGGMERALQPSRGRTLRADPCRGQRRAPLPVADRPRSRHHPQADAGPAGREPVPGRQRPARSVAAVQRHRIRPRADERLPAGRRTDRDPGFQHARRADRAEGAGDRQLHGLRRAGALEGREHRSGAGPDRLADPAARADLRPLLPAHLGPAATRRDRRAAGRRQRGLWLGRRPRGSRLDRGA
ncbi:FAD-dependent oxidoreductase [Caulobacter sp. UC70_42]|uniref:FAD-dependent oxidoreductase n=1 Tax=Caulobacter sp. UC70_42 TaxID=3374551 RepID=UPI0037562DB2